MTKFTKEMLETLKQANESVKGTSYYMKYLMPCFAKNEKGRWFFIGWHIPHTEGVIKAHKGELYIYSLDERHIVTGEVKELLDL